MRTFLMPRPAMVALALLAARPSSARAQSTLEYTAMDFAFRGASTVAAGMTTIRLKNAGTKLHHVQMFRLADGKRLTDLFPVLSANRGVHNAPAWAQPAGGPSAALPGQTIEVRQHLAPGRYAVICWIPAPDGSPHFMKGMMTELEVTGSARPLVEPRADVRVALAEYRATLSSPLRAGRLTLRIHNAGRQDHEFLLVRLKPGERAETVERWSGAGQVTAAPVERWVGLAGIAPGGVAWLDVDLTPGRYAILCLAPDKSDGRPHAMLGFREEIQVR